MYQISSKQISNSFILLLRTWFWWTVRLWSANYKRFFCLSCLLPCCVFQVDAKQRCGCWRTRSLGTQLQEIHGCTLQETQDGRSGHCGDLKRKKRKRNILFWKYFNGQVFLWPQKQAQTILCFSRLRVGFKPQMGLYRDKQTLTHACGKFLACFHNFSGHAGMEMAYYVWTKRFLLSDGCDNFWWQLGW